MNSNENTILEEKEIKADKKPKSKAKKIILKILLGILIVIVAFVAVTTVVSLIGVSSNINKARNFPSADTKQLTTENYSNGCYNIYTDDGLKVMQLTDVHIGGGFMSIKKDSMAINAVAAMITAE